MAAGSTATYTATLTNNGPDAATGLAGTVQLPRGLFNVTGGSYDFNSGLLRLTLPATTLGNGLSQQLAVTFSAPTNTQPLQATAASTAASTDPTAGNNDGSAAGANVFTQVQLPASACGTGYNGLPAVQGLYAEFFKGSPGQTYTGDPAYFTGKAPALTRTDANLYYFNRYPLAGDGAVVNSNWGDIMAAASGTAAQPEYFSVRERGYLLVTKPGIYTFSAAIDDVATLWLDASAQPTPPTGTATPLDGYTGVYLAAGPHALQLLYGQGPVNSFLVLSYSGPDTNNQKVVVPNSAFCSAQTLASPLATATAATQPTLTLYPTPTSNLLHVETVAQHKATMLELRSLSGACVLRAVAPAAALTLDLQTLPAGLYLLQERFDDGTVVTRKLVKL